MNIKLLKIDERLYRALKARAAIEGRTIGDLFNDAIRGYLSGSKLGRRRKSLRDLQPEPYPKGNQQLSERIDQLLYRRRRGPIPSIGSKQASREKI